MGETGFGYSADGRAVILHVHRRAADLVTALGLQPHPEGGRFREIYRSAAAVDPRDGRPVRSAVTAIYYLLVAGEMSRWHRVRSDEVWHFLEGDPLELQQASEGFAEVEKLTARHPALAAFV